MTDSVKEAAQVNTLVTSLHIVLIVAYTLVSILADNLDILHSYTTF